MDARITTLAGEATDIVNRVDEEGRDFTAEEQARIKSIFDEAKSLRDTRSKASERIELRDRIGGLVSADEARDLNGVVGTDGKDAGKVLHEFALPKTQLLSDRVINDAGFKSFLAQWPDGIPDSVKGIRTPPVRVGGLKDIITSGTVGPLINPDYWGMVPPIYQRPLVVRDLITIGRTSTDTIEFARLTSVDNQAAPVPEATQAAGSGTKPQSSMTFERVTTPVRTIAHWLAATKRALADAGQLRTLIDNFLRYGLNEALEEEVVSGDGTGEHFTGILNTAGILAQPFVEDVLTTIRKAITQVQLTGRTNPTAVLLNPQDDEAFDLLKNSNGDFLAGNAVPWVSGQPRTIWGIPRVVSESVPAGTAVLGNFRMAVLWDREAATITATDSHDDFFIRNLIAILAELRAAFGVLQPSAFVEIDLTEAGP